MFLDSLGEAADCFSVVFLAQVLVSSSFNIMFSTIASSSIVSMKMGDRKSVLRRIWLFLGGVGLGGDRPGLSSGGDRDDQAHFRDRG